MGKGGRWRDVEEFRYIRNHTKFICNQVTKKKLLASTVTVDFDSVGDCLPNSQCGSTPQLCSAYLFSCFLL